MDLVEEADERAPDRSHASDGSIGDAAHSARESDHNPDDGWVCAVDLDDDDDSDELGVRLLRQHLVASQDERVKYLIHEGTIWKAYENRGLPPWTPQPYTGVNAHKSHLHVSVWNTPEARNDTSSWWPTPQPQPAPAPEDDDDMPLIVKAESKPEVWVTDGIHKRLLEDEAEINELVYVGAAKWNKGKPFAMTLDVLSDIPTVSK